MEAIQAGPNTEKIVEVLSREKGLCDGTLIVCQVKGSANPVYKRKVGCAVGALLFHAGWSPIQIDQLHSDLSDDSYWCDEHFKPATLCGCAERLKEMDPNVRALKTLEREYGLEYHHVELIMGVNDDPHFSRESMKKRRDRVIEFVRTELR